MSAESKRARLRNLFESDSHCYWCGRLTRFGSRKHPDTRPRGNRLPKDLATLDHIVSHLAIPRSDPAWNTFKNVIVLSCFECNQRRQIEEGRTIPKEELWKRSGRYPMVLPKGEK